MPIFEKQFYSVSVKEDVEMYSALFVAIQAESPLKRKLIYTASSDSTDQYFEVDYRTGKTEHGKTNNKTIIKYFIFQVPCMWLTSWTLRNSKHTNC